MSQTQPIANQEEIDRLSFEDALAELEGIVRELESGQGDLEKAIADYERGTQLKDHCMKKLNQAKLKVEKIMQNQEGETTTQAFEGES